MKPLISTNQFPPNGWVYRETIGGRSWTNPDTMLPFWDVVSTIVRARANNPGSKPATAESAAQDLADYTCKRLNNDTRWCEGIAVASESAVRRRSGGCGGCGSRKKKK